MKYAICLLMLLLTRLSVADTLDCENLKSHLHNGDVILIDVNETVFHEVGLATHSWATHAGMAFQIDGEWKILESRIPLSTESNFCDFVQKRSKNQYYAIRRLSQSLTDDEVNALKTAAESKLGRPYNISFDYDAWGEFCSKFVFDVYREALGVDIGKIETFGDLIAKYPNDDIAFWNIWFLGKIPMGRRTVTPADLYFSSVLTTIEEKTPTGAW